MVNRWFLYLKERYHLLQWTIISVLLTTGIFAVLNSANSLKTVFFWKEYGLGIINILLFFLYNHIFDEFKDVEIDKIYFPERPVPSGRVQLNDLRILEWIVIILLFAINLIWNSARLEFLVTILVYYLAAKWFFMPELISNNRIMAFITHSPIWYFLLLLVIAPYANKLNQPLLTKTNLIIALWFLLPFLISEIARKTRSAIEDQDGYQSYSQLLGFRNTVLVLMLFILIHFLILLNCSIHWGISYPVLILYGLLSATYLGLCVQFIVKEPQKTDFMSKLGHLYLLLSFAFVAFIRF